MEGDLLDVAALGLELPLEQIAGLLGLCPRQAEDADVVRPDGVRHECGEDRDRHPCHDDTAAVSHTPVGKTPDRCLLP
jgi:hypothetical protein